MTLGESLEIDITKCKEVLRTVSSSYGISERGVLEIASAYNDLQNAIQMKKSIKESDQKKDVNTYTGFGKPDVSHDLLLLKAWGCLDGKKENV